MILSGVVTLELVSVCCVELKSKTSGGWTSVPASAVVLAVGVAAVVTLAVGSLVAAAEVVEAVVVVGASFTTTCAKAGSAKTSCMQRTNEIRRANNRGTSLR